LLGFVVSQLKFINLHLFCAFHIHGSPCRAQATSQFQGQANACTVDIQRLRHLHLIFQPLEYVPSGPIFKKHIAQVYMED
jgi:hypothetical protein